MNSLYQWRAAIKRLLYWYLVPWKKFDIPTRYCCRFSTHLVLKNKLRKFFCVSEARFRKYFLESFTRQNPKFSLNFAQFSHYERYSKLGYSWILCTPLYSTISFIDLYKAIFYWTVTQAALSQNLRTINGIKRNIHFLFDRVLNTIVCHVRNASLYMFWILLNAQHLQQIY